MANLEYNTIDHIGQGEYEEKKSRFLGAAYPVKSPEEAQEILAGIRKQYYDARHHCSAYVLGSDRLNKRSSDDGEPQGSAGAPILAVIDGAECTDVLIVVTRYFGGTLLGTGGLVRAYTAAAQAALADAGIVRMQEGEILALTMAYPFYDKVTYLLGQEGIKILDTQYTDKVSLQALVRTTDKARICELIQALGSGQIEVKSSQKDYFSFDLDVPTD